MQMEDDFTYLADSNALVIDLPVAQTNRLTKQRVSTLLPVVVLVVGDQVFYPKEAFEWGRSRIFKANEDVRRREMNTIARLYECWQRFPEFKFEELSDIDLLIWTYLFHRLYSPKNVRDRVFPTWSQITYQVAVQEFSTIRSFATFCKKNFPEGSELARAFCGASDIFNFELPSRPREDTFFQHLNIQRDRWKVIVGLDPAFPKELKRVGSRTVKYSQKRDRTPTEKQVSAIIDAEENVMFRALWLLLFGTGIRISEALNLWTCDVLPSSYSPQFCGYETFGEPLIILGHPIDCTYTGKIDAKSDDLCRDDFLRDRFKLTARPLMSGGEFAGWKGMFEAQHTRRYSWAFWNNFEFAAGFRDLFPEIIAVHRASGAPERSPFFFCNSSPRSKYFGNFMRYKNAADAFKRACDRVGVPTGSNGFSLHSGRHHYAWRSKVKLKLSEEDRQIGLHHTFIGSQKSYGQKASDLYHLLSAIEKGDRFGA